MSESDSMRMRSPGEVKRPGSAQDKNDHKNIYFDDPCHNLKDSVLSYTNGSVNNYHGLLNLAVILLVLSNARVALGNLIKYGILVEPFQWIKIFFENPLYRPTFVLLLISNIFILIALFIERFVVKRSLSEKKANQFIIGNIILVLLTPIVVNTLFVCNLILSSLVCSVYSIVTLKLISYHCVNYWCRNKIKYGIPITKSTKIKAEYIEAQTTKKLVIYPNNLGVIDIYYFMFAPTLCYQINFPRTERIRKDFLLKRLVEYLILTQIMVALVQQWIIPAVENSTEPFNDMKYSQIAERLLLLAVPNHIIWLLFFYSYFQSLLNIFGELLRFGDRDFYHDWWNSESVDGFWKNWNIPVHKWCVRHLFKPLVYRGYTGFQATCAVFLLSAFFHEYVVSIPLKMLRYWSFLAMLAQIPFTFIVSKYLKGHFANIAIWLSLIIGQPLAILMYYHDYYVSHLATN